MAYPGDLKNILALVLSGSVALALICLSVLYVQLPHTPTCTFRLPSPPGGPGIWWVGFDYLEFPIYENDTR